MADDDPLKEIHRTLITFNKRAERSSDAMLVASFVDSAPLFDLLSTTNNQVIYGRRGTGKTHALKFLAEKVEQQGEHPIYLDLRSVGSNGSIYADADRPLAERASTLLVDVLGALNDELFGLALAIIDRHPHPEEVTRRLDTLQSAISTIKISGQAAVETNDSASEKTTSGLGTQLELAPRPSLAINARRQSDSNQDRTAKVTRTGREFVHLTFGNIAGALGDLFDILLAKRVWLLIDEWSEIPIEIQPYLADLIRKILLPINNITIKIAAIEHRSAFAILKHRGEYIGIELGSDISADLNLDDFLVFDNSEEKATQFVKTLLFKHYVSSGGGPTFEDADQFIHTTFTQYPAFEEFVRAVEGVPRDALNLAAKVATKAFGQRVAMQHVRAAARDWYNQDKAAAIRSSPELNDLLAHIVERVIANRRARAFLFPSNVRHDGVEKLFDSRLLHILKKNVSAHDQPGARFDVYKIDYGCYVDLINTTRAPQGLFEMDESGGFIEVPRDDYRSIRRAVLFPEDISTLARAEENTAAQPASQRELHIKCAAMSNGRRRNPESARRNSLGMRDRLSGIDLVSEIASS